MTQQDPMYPAEPLDQHLEEATYVAESLQALIERASAGDGTADGPQLEANSSLHGANDSFPAATVLSADLDPIATELPELAAFAGRLTSVLSVRMRPASRALLQANLQAKLPSSRPTHSQPRATWQRWLPRFGALMIAGTLTFGSAIAASADSLPGDPLYAFKRLGEQAQLALTWDRAERIDTRQALADRRLAEIKQLAKAGRPVDAEVAGRLVQAFAELTTLVEASGDAGLASATEARAKAARSELESLSKSSPPADRIHLTEAAQALVAMAGALPTPLPTEPAPTSSLPTPTLGAPAVGTATPLATERTASPAPRRSMATPTHAPPTRNAPTPVSGPGTAPPPDVPGSGGDRPAPGGPTAQAGSGPAPEDPPTEPTASGSSDFAKQRATDMAAPPVPTKPPRR